MSFAEPHLPLNRIVIAPAEFYGGLIDGRRPAKQWTIPNV
jgi:hypothetical protein